jgi:hypothetical protein
VEKNNNNGVFELIWVGFAIELLVTSSLSKKMSHDFYLEGKPRMPHLLRCQGFAVEKLRLHPWSPWIWGILGFCNVRVNCNGRQREKGKYILKEKLHASKVYAYS